MKFYCFYSMSMLISIRENNRVQGVVNLPLRIDTDVLARLCDYFKCSITDIIYYMTNQKMNIAC
ncbi:MAG: helix-turn-helix domain-containing protein [Lachnospiraceae bacterium]|nr:helix-turn-helix domain-containing protein [Lachnospiraceae bacterium]